MRKAVVNRKVVQCRQRKAAQCKAGTAEEESSAKAEDRDRQLKEFTKLRELKELQVRTPRLSCPALSPLCSAEWSAVFAGCGDCSKGGCGGCSEVGCGGRGAEGAPRLL
jgi:hypothetical protein